MTASRREDQNPGHAHMATQVDDLQLVWGRHEPAADRRPRLAEPPPPPVSGSALGRYRALVLRLAVSDAASIVVALLISYYLRYHGMRPMPVGELAIVGVAPLVWIVAFWSFNLYAPQHLSPPEELRRVIGATSLGIVLLILASYWSKSSFSRMWTGTTWLLVLVLEFAARWAWGRYQERLKTDGRLAFRTLIVGTTGEATRLAEILGSQGSGFTPLGHVATSDPSLPVSPLPLVGDVNPLPLVGDIAGLRELIRGHAADCLFVASTSVGAEDMARIGQVARQEGVEVRVSANLPQTLTSRLTLQNVGGAIAISMRPVRLSGTQIVLKRAFDIVVASAALVLTLPLWIVIAVAIRLSSPGPLLFHQERITKGGNPFQMHKFRSMRVDVQGSIDTSSPFFKLESDPRLTGIGRFIRRFSLDELPQFLNVLKGEMSLVGPRPLPADQVAANLQLLSPRHEVPAGVTGWWQINGRNGVTPEEAVRLDLFYIENWSLALDLYIVLKTFGAVLSARGAY